MITYLLECGHTGQRRTLASVDSIMPCWCRELPAPAASRVVAVECREWKAFCQSCTYRRWFGQDLAECQRACTLHMNRTGHPSCTPEFMLVRELAIAVREAFGRKVKTHFEVKPSIDASRLNPSLNVAVAKTEELAGQEPLF